MSRATATFAQNSSFLGRLAQAVSAFVRREKARQQSIVELSRMDSATLADLGLNPHTLSPDVTRRRRSDRKDDVVQVGHLIRELDGPAAPLHPLTEVRTTGFVQTPSAFVAHNITQRRLRKTAANKNAPVNKVATA